MDGNINVKSLMAKFNNGSIPIEEVSANNRPFKLQGNSASQARTAFQKFNQPVDTTPAPGPNALRNTLSPKPAVGAKSLQEDKVDNDPKLPFRKPNSALHKYGGSIRSAQTEPDGKARFPKSSGLKPTEQQKEDSKPPFSKSPVHKSFLSSVAQENEIKPAGPKPSFPAEQQENEVKSEFPRPSEARAAFLAASRKSDPQTSFPTKPGLEQKPSVATHALNNDDNSSKTSPVPKRPVVLRATKPAINSPKPTMGNLENNNGSDSSVQGFPAVTLKPTIQKPTIQSVQSPFLNQNTEENNDVPKPSVARNVFQNRESSAAASFSTPKFQKPNLTSPGGGSQEKEEGKKDSLMPKRKTLPPLSTIGPAPQKSPRPPNVDLERFKKNAIGDSLNKGLLNKQTPPPTLHSTVLPPPPPQGSHPSVQTPLPPLPAVHLPTHPPVPSLPPRNIKPPSESMAPDGENYDDVEFNSSLEGNQAHGSLDENEESDQEMYEDIRSPRKEQEIRREKEEKKRQELEKKEQREKEKKEQEIRKRFKLVGPIEVVHQARACVDYKGGKNELNVKQGDQIEIIRITDNPEGKWLGRVKDSYGYIKTTLVEIDYDSLRDKKSTSKQEENDQEVYDDVGEQDSINSRTDGGNGSGSGSGTFFPPPPGDDDIYDGIEDSISSVQQEEEKPSTWAWGLFKMITGKDDKKKTVEDKRVQEDEEEDIADSFTHLSHADAEEVYDDVEDFPPPPKNISLGINMKSFSLGRGKGEEKDVKKFKKIEKEEKDFRKRFKYDGEVRVLYSAQVNTLLTAKKWGAKDLPLKPGESLEVIQDTDDTKVLCRNDEGKYGYVLRSNLMGKDGDIYDDIGDGCIYDND